MGSRLSDYLGSLMTRLFGSKNSLYQKDPSSGTFVAVEQGNTGIPKAPNISIPKPAPTPQPTPAPLQQTIDQGLQKFSVPPPPVATLSGQLAQAGQQLPDPLLPTILSLMETGGLNPNQTQTPNNMFNIGPGINYANPETAILGGGPSNQLGLQGILRPGGIYQDYLDSGNLLDFFRHFTPSSDPRNPSQDQLVERYNMLRSLFQ